MNKIDIHPRWLRYIEGKLLPIVADSLDGKGFLEGNIYSGHKQIGGCDALLPKQKNIINLVEAVQPNSILEIGFNAGFSALLMKMSAPEASITCIDVNQHRYVIPCYKQVATDYPGVDLYAESSLAVLPRLAIQRKTYDIIHIDGDHRAYGARRDLDHCLDLCHDKTVIIFDDTNLSHLNQLCESYISRGKMRNYLMDSFIPCIDKKHRFFVK